MRPLARSTALLNTHPPGRVVSPPFEGPRGARDFLFVVSGFGDLYPITCIFHTFRHTNRRLARWATDATRGGWRIGGRSTTSVSPLDDRRAVIPRDTTSFRTPTPPPNARQTTMVRAGVRSLPHAVGRRIPQRRRVRAPTRRPRTAIRRSVRERRCCVEGIVAPPAPRSERSPPTPSSTSQEAVFPEALKSLKEADPDVYALVQKEKLRQMCVPPRADPIDPDAPARSDRRLYSDYAAFPARGRERPPPATLTPLSFPRRPVSSSRAARASSSSPPRTSPPRP